jgi:hypothetical protein
MEVYRLVRTANGVERHLVEYVNGKPVSSKRVSDTAVLKDWKKYLRDTIVGSIDIREIK